MRRDPTGYIRPRAFGSFAVLLALMVVAIGQFAVRPDWHVALHDQTGPEPHGQSQKDPQIPSDEDAGCPIDLYGSGGILLLECRTRVAASDPTLIQHLTVAQPGPVPPSSASGQPPGRAPPSFRFH